LTGRGVFICDGTKKLESNNRRGEKEKILAGVRETAGL